MHSIHSDVHRLSFALSLTRHQIESGGGWEKWESEKSIKLLSLNHLFFQNRWVAKVGD